MTEHLKSPMSPQEDRALLATFAETRSEEAFVQLVDRHRGLVERLVRRRVGDTEAARDVVQQVFALLARKAEGLTTHPTLAGWLVRTSMLEAQRYQRKERNRMKRERRHAEEQQAEVAGADSGEFSQEDMALVETGLSEMPASTRDAILLRFYESRSFREIGERLGKSEAAAQKMVARGVARLRRQLQRRPGQEWSASQVASLLGVVLVSKPLSTSGVASSLSLAQAALQHTGAISKGALWSHGLSVSAPLFLTPGKVAIMLGLAAALGLPLASVWRANHARSTEEANRALGVESILPERVSPRALPEVPESVGVPGVVPDEAIAQLPPRHAQLLDDLLDAEWKIRRGAALAIKEAGLPPEIAVPALSEVLSDEEWQVRQAVASALAAYGEAAASAVPSLLTALADEEWHVRAEVAHTLAAVGEAAGEEAVRPLMESLADEEWQVRNPAAMALASIGPVAAPAVSGLGNALADEEWHVANNAGAALAAIGPPASPAVPQLVEALGHEEWHVRASAAFALGEIGQDAAIALAQLEAMGRDDVEDQVRRIASEAGERLRMGAAE